MDGAGHRTVPHTADVRLEAWAPSREGCLAEAVAALVDSFADASAAPPTGTVAVAVDRDADADGLVAVLDEVIFLLDTRGLVPVRTNVDRVDGGLDVRFDVADAADVAPVGAVPKAVSWHDLRWQPRDQGWWCAVTVDV